MKTNKTIWLTGVGIICLPSLVWAKQNVQQPNILFILCDDMGYGDLACYGQPYIHTPNIDQMAKEGMRFTQAYAGSPVSAPSRATIMTGQHSGHTHVRGNKEYWRNVPMVKYGVNEDFSVVGQEPYDPQHKILPEMLKDKGYRTGVFGKWAGGYEGSASTPDKRGIDEFYGYICQFQAHLYYPNFLNRYSKSQGDTAVVREIMEQNIQYPMFGKDYFKRKQYSARIITTRLWSGLTSRIASILSWDSSPIPCLMPNWLSQRILSWRTIRRNSSRTRPGADGKIPDTTPQFIPTPSLPE